MHDAQDDDLIGRSHSTNARTPIDGAFPPHIHLRSHALTTTSRSPDCRTPALTYDILRVAHSAPSAAASVRCVLASWDRSKLL